MEPKLGLISCVVHKVIEAPVVSTEQRVEFAIRCAMFVYEEVAWTTWANGWLNGGDRTAAAEAAAEAEAWAAAKQRTAATIVALAEAVCR